MRKSQNVGQREKLLQNQVRREALIRRAMAEEGDEEERWFMVRVHEGEKERIARVMRENVDVEIVEEGCDVCVEDGEGEREEGDTGKKGKRRRTSPLASSPRSSAVSASRRRRRRVGKIRGGTLGGVVNIRALRAASQYEKTLLYRIDAGKADARDTAPPHHVKIGRPHAETETPPPPPPRPPAGDGTLHITGIVRDTLEIDA